MKTLTPVLIAFFLGMVLCFTIQACGGDKDDRTPAPNSAQSGSGGWDTEKFSSEMLYTASGTLELEKVYTYDAKSRIIEQTTYEYDQNGVKVSTNFYRYTYDGNTRTRISDEGYKLVQTLYAK